MYKTVKRYQRDKKKTDKTMPLLQRIKKKKRKKKNSN